MVRPYRCRTVDDVMILAAYSDETLVERAHDVLAELLDHLRPPGDWGADHEHEAMAAILLCLRTPFLYLRKARCPDRVLDLLDLLTRRPGEDEDRHLARLAADPGAFRIKMAAYLARDRDQTADLRHRLDLWRSRWNTEWDIRYHPEGHWTYWLHEDENIGLMRQWRWPRSVGWSMPEYLCEGRWMPGSRHALDAITGMGDEVWSCGPFSTALSEEEAAAYAAARGASLSAPRAFQLITDTAESHRD